VIVDNSAILSTQGLLLTLISLLGTFFYVHLSGWRKDLIKLKAKWEQNHYNQTNEQKAAVLEVRYELPGLSNYVTPLVSLVVTAFILLVAGLSYALWTPYCGPPTIRTSLTIAGIAFLILYVLLTGGFLIGGMMTAKELNDKICKKFADQKPADAEESAARTPDRRAKTDN
jgi:hypothetical protein